MSTLFNHYASKGQPLPSLAERARMYEADGLGPAPSYRGTADQNNALLEKPRNPVTPPLAVPSAEPELHPKSTEPITQNIGSFLHGLLEKIRTLFTTLTINSLSQPCPEHSPRVSSLPQPPNQPSRAQVPDLPPSDKQPTEVTRLTQLTVQQVLDRQNQEKMFAVGRYQFIPTTLADAVKSAKIEPDSKFDSETQDRIFEGFLFPKRPAIGRYFNGQGTLDDALLALAQEFASIPVPYDVINDRGTQIFKGESFYKDRGNNRASHSVDSVRLVLEQRDLRLLAKFVAKGEGNYDSINRGTAGDTPTGSQEYLDAIR